MTLVEVFRTILRDTITDETAVEEIMMRAVVLRTTVEAHLLSTS